MIVPPDLAYGQRGRGLEVPVNATLTFDVEILGVSAETPKPPNMFVMLDKDGDGKISKEEMERYFTDKGGSIPHGLFQQEDKDHDGFVSWQEFTGPKGDAPPNEEPAEEQPTIEEPIEVGEL